MIIYSNNNNNVVEVLVTTDGLLEVFFISYVGNGDKTIMEHKVFKSIRGIKSTANRLNKCFLNDEDKFEPATTKDIEAKIKEELNK